MAIDLYAFAEAGRTRNSRVRVEANIPLSLLGQREHDGTGLDTRRLLEPLRLAARESLDYIGRPGSGVSVDVDCEIPVGAGLGSSAATIVAIIAATTRAHGKKLGKKKICEIAFGPESYLHGKPSGVDQATCTYGGILQFHKPDKVTKLNLKRIPTILVCDTGIHRSTKGLVSNVVKRSESEVEFFQEHVEEASQISKAAVKALTREDDNELGALMNGNHELLTQIGVSHPRLNQLVKAARKAGALGAKLTGAGGGGSMIALCEDEKSRSKVGRILRRHGGTPYFISMDESGVQSDSNRTALK